MFSFLNRLRQAAATIALGATLDQATQAVAVTVNWFPTQVGSTVTYVQVSYTQTFASAPGLLTTAGSASIGLGTITGTVGVVKERSGAMSVMPSGSLFTVAVAGLGMLAGMGMVML